jgi:hypothetical protein
MKKEPKPSVTLALVHNIFLTREQRYNLHAGKTVQTSGVQVPVWHQRGYTSEPATEVFCRYVLNNKPDGDTEIEMNSWGYEFNLPQSVAKQLPKIDPNQWRAMTRDQQDEWYNQFPQVPTSRNLLEPEHGGSGNISFNQKALSKANGVPVNVLHYVRIDTVEALKESLV